MSSISSTTYDTAPPTVLSKSGSTDSLASSTDERRSVNKTKLLATAIFAAATVGFTLGAIFSATILVIPAVVCALVTLGLLVSFLPAPRHTGYSDSGSHTHTTVVIDGSRPAPRSRWYAQPLSFANSRRTHDGFAVVNTDDRSRRAAQPARAAPQPARPAAQPARAAAQPARAAAPARFVASSSSSPSSTSARLPQADMSRGVGRRNG